MSERQAMARARPLAPLAAALAAAALAGCAALGGPGGRDASAMQRRLVAGADRGGADREVAETERAVARRRDDPALRGELGRAYLAAGRFESAVAAFDDALELGDGSAATVIGLALGEVALGNRAAALQLLDEWHDVLPAADRGLALALAGETARGVEVLAEALRRGESSARLRQNLAYAYALDGRWREAWLMAAQDVPPDRLDERIAEWAGMGRPEAARQRIAHLLGAPLRDDHGYPQALALAPASATPPFGEPAGEIRPSPTEAQAPVAQR